MLRSFFQQNCAVRLIKEFCTYVRVILLESLSVIEVPESFISGPSFQIRQKVHPPSKVTIVVTLILSLLVAGPLHVVSGFLHGFCWLVLHHDDG